MLEDLFFRLHQEEPNVVHLQVHLPDEHLMTYDETNSPEEILAAAEAKTTTLLQWFNLNKKDPSACWYLYQDIPAHYTWNKNKKCWNPHQRHTTIGGTIGRMYPGCPLMWRAVLSVASFDSCCWRSIFPTSTHC